MGAQRRVQQPVCGRQDRLRPTQMVCATALVPQPKMGVCGCTQGLGARTWGLESRPGEGTAVGCEETACRDRIEELHNQKCLWRKPRPPQKQSTIAE